MILTPLQAAPVALRLASVTQARVASVLATPESAIVVLVQ